ncbi:TIGR02234 family membrane protein [Gordonia sp. HY285]|uniref:TIGR02234 family membrane protein n=1 Tax=Gordonia liuliyuniae TaxID=2911517 RepID=A0ABS9IUJ2_9ACTN|nr:TIGR02234 family membrane protein [Gordonia liuliyuniae]MCF8589232.1 TIGR02234 family membrane protein [Gordonia liuliyuniae]MCF8611192.1 TIGR02234 family membrane protein [Gordonia liuliyuniae]
MTDSEQATGGSRSGGRRRQGIAGLLLAIAAIVLWTVSRMRWAEVIAEDGLGVPRTFDVNGSDWSPWLVAVALLFVAGIVAQFAVSGWVLRLVALILALAAVLSAVPAISLINNGQNNMFAADAIDLDPKYDVRVILTSNTPAYLLLVGAVCAAIAAVLMMRGATAGGMSSKYTSPAARREELEKKVFAERERAARGEETESDGNERLLWDSLDNGVDPTDERP